MRSLTEKILKNAKIIAIYGASTNKEKDSYMVMQYLQNQGYKTIPINFFTEQTYVLGEKIYKNLEDVKINLDILNIFRPSNEILEIAKKSVNVNIKTFWLQLDIFCSESEKILRDRGIIYIDNKCTKIEHLKFINNQ